MGYNQEMKMYLDKLKPKGQEKLPEVKTQGLLKGAMEALVGGQLEQGLLTAVRDTLIPPQYQRVLAQKGVIRSSLSNERIEIALEIRRSSDPKKIEERMRVIIWGASDGSSGIKLVRGVKKQTTITECALPTTLGMARAEIRRVIEETLRS